MHVRFWGTRGSIAKPGPNTVRYGGNTSCVEVRSASGTVVVLDCGTGAHELGAHLVAEEPGVAGGNILISHTHWDHIQGFPFFAPLRNPDGDWNVYGPRGVGRSLRDTLAGQMDYTYFPVELENLDARLSYHELVEGTFELGDIHIETIYLNHPAVTLGYRLEADGVALVYATDHEPHCRERALGDTPTEPSTADDAHARFLEGADLVIHDAQYTAAEYPRHVGWGHSTIEYVVNQTRDKGIRRLALYHHDPMRDDRGVERLVRSASEMFEQASEKTQVLGAAEGMSLELEPRKRGRKRRPAHDSARTIPIASIREQPVILCAGDTVAGDAFRRAAVADGLKLLETGTARAAAALALRHAARVVIVHRDFLEPGCPELEPIPSRYPDSTAGPVIVVLGEASGGATACARAHAELALPISEQYARSRLRAWLLSKTCRWRPAPRPPRETSRMDALRRLEILDTPPDDRFDRYTRMAAALFKVPTALFSLIDTDRQWFKSTIGSDLRETPRDQAFCAHAILGAEVMQIKDASTHADFADNPLVKGPPYLRFYAGTPIRVDGIEPIGTLCLIDTVARELDSAQLAMLEDLGYMLENELSVWFREKRSTEIPRSVASEGE